MSPSTLNGYNMKECGTYIPNHPLFSHNVNAVLDDIIHGSSLDTSMLRPRSDEIAAVASRALSISNIIEITVGGVVAAVVTVWLLLNAWNEWRRSR